MDTYPLMKAAFIGAVGAGLFAACSGSGIMEKATPYLAPHLPEEVQTMAYQLRSVIRTIDRYTGSDAEPIDLVGFLFALNESGISDSLTRFGQDVGDNIGLRGLDSLLDALDGENR